MAEGDEGLRNRAVAAGVEVPIASRRQFLQTAAAAASTALLPRALAGPPRSAAAGASYAPAPDVSGAASLGAHAAARQVLYGCAVNVGALNDDPVYNALIRAQCRILVAENAMKWAALRPSANSFRFEQADALLAFAESNRMKLRGHTLAWHLNNPTWVDATLTAAKARAALVLHIETVVGRYAGRMHSWDVVNEAIEGNDGRADHMRSSVWLRLVGDDYLELAFQTARGADPQALLTLNEYGIEQETPQAERKRQAVLQLLRRMVARRVPIDALGVQSHLSALATAQTGGGPAYGPGLLRLLASVRELGLQVFVTELDVNDRAAPPDLAFRDAAVAATYRHYLDEVLAEPAVRAVLTWGITDRYGWLDQASRRPGGEPQRPLPFDTACRPAAAFFAMRDAFDRRGGLG